MQLLEIDLLRGGERPPLERLCIRAVLCYAEGRSDVAGRCMAIELADHYRAARALWSQTRMCLRLGATVASVYERGAYVSQIDYHATATPLAKTQADWLEAFCVLSNTVPCWVLVHEPQHLKKGEHDFEI